MRTYIVGTRYPVQLGLLVAKAQRAAKLAAQTPLPAGKHAVVSRGFAGALQGYTANGAQRGNGTLYGVFATAAQAFAYQKARKMQLYTSIVAW